MSWLMANWAVLLTSLLAIVGGAAVALKMVAPLTKNTKDDKVASFLDRVVGVLSRLALQKK